MARIRRAESFRRFGGNRKGGSKRGYTKRFNNRRSFSRDDSNERWLYFGSALLSFDNEVKESANGNRYIKFQVMYNGSDDQEHTATGVIFENMENQIALAARAFGYEVEDFDGLLQVIEEAGNEEVPVVVSVKIREDGYYNVLLCNPDKVRNGKSKRPRRGGNVRKVLRDDDDSNDSGGDDAESSQASPEPKPAKVVIRKLNKPIPQEALSGASESDASDEEVQV
jgi:hypothetical protein